MDFRGECVTLADVFDRLHLATSDNDHAWVLLKTSCSDINLARLDTTPGVSWLRAQYELPVSWSDACAFTRPEMFFHPKRPLFDRYMSECAVEKVLNPGDAICRFSFRLLATVLRDASLLFTPRTFAAAASLIKTIAVGRDVMSIRVRMALRRDFPQPGMFSAAIAPMHPETGTLLEELGLLKATTAIIAPHGCDPGKVNVTEIKQLIRVPNWAAELAARHHFYQFDVISRLPEMREAVRESCMSSGSSDYVVLGLRKCTRGLPMLPKKDWSRIQASEADPCDDWEQPQPDKDFTFATYLRTFLSMVEVSDVEIYDQLDGGFLVPYQAVATRGAWDRAWIRFAEPFRASRTAYRRMVGGRCAPEIVVGAEPRFLPPGKKQASKTDHSLLCPEDEHQSQDIAGHIPVLKTFVHFRDNSLRCHCGSVASTLEDLEFACTPVLSH